MAHNTTPRSGNFYDSQGNVRNDADGINADGSRNVRASAVKAVAVVPNDGADIASAATLGLYIGGAGNVAVVMSDGSEVIFIGLAAGIIHPLAVKRVKATGTTASSILAVY